MVGCGSRAVPRRKKSGPTVGQIGQDQRTLGVDDHSRYQAGVGKLHFMINEVPEIANAVKNLSRQLAGPSELDMQDLKQCVRYTLGHSDEWLFLTVQDKPRKPDEVATIEAFADADWIGDTRSTKSTSSVFTRIDGFTIGMNAQLQDTHAQSSGESEFHALGAGCADGLYVKAILDDLGMQAKINLRCDAKEARALAQRQALQVTSKGESKSSFCKVLKFVMWFSQALSFCFILLAELAVSGFLRIWASAVRQLRSCITIFFSAVSQRARATAFNSGFENWNCFSSAGCGPVLGLRIRALAEIFTASCFAGASAMAGEFKLKIAEAVTLVTTAAALSASLGFLKGSSSSVSSHQSVSSQVLVGTRRVLLMRQPQPQQGPETEVREVFLHIPD